MRKYNFIGICIIAIVLIGSFFVPIQIKANFDLAENFIPKRAILMNISELKNIRLIQLNNWLAIKTKMLKAYPMISEISINWVEFPVLNINFKEKKPWVLVIQDEHQYLFSKDGTLLNKGMNDIELPDNNIIIVKSNTDVLNKNTLNTKYLEELLAIDSELSRVPYLSIQKVLLNKSDISIITNKGIKIRLGDTLNIKDKFIVLKYFYGYYREKISKLEYIDIRFPKRVIIKHIEK